MSLSHGKGSWLQQVAELLGGEKACERRPIRRLAAERLERRNVLCTAAAAIAPTAVIDETNLMELYEHAAAMGPAQPALSSEEAAASTESSSAAQDDSASDPGFADQYFTNYAGQGEGEGEGGGSGSGSGGGSATGSGSGGGACSGSGSGCGEASGSGSGGGQGSGSGGGSSSGSGSGGEEENEAPTVSVGFEAREGVLYFTGTVSDDGTLDGLTVRFGDLIIQDVIVNPDGTFTFQVPSPETGGIFTFSVTDDHGLTSGTNYGEYGV
jgi:hypothetical protein